MNHDGCLLCSLLLDACLILRPKFIFNYLEYYALVFYLLSVKSNKSTYSKASNNINIFIMLCCRCLLWCFFLNYYVRMCRECSHLEFHVIITMNLYVGCMLSMLLSLCMLMSLDTKINLK